MSAGYYRWHGKYLSIGNHRHRPHCASFSEAESENMGYFVLPFITRHFILSKCASEIYHLRAGLLPIIVHVARAQNYVGDIIRSPEIFMAFLVASFIVIFGGKLTLISVAQMKLSRQAWHISRLGIDGHQCRWLKMIHQHAGRWCDEKRPFYSLGKCATIASVKFVCPYRRVSCPSKSSDAWLRCLSEFSPRVGSIAGKIYNDASL